MAKTPVTRTMGMFGKTAPLRPVGLHSLAYYQTAPLPTPPASITLPQYYDWGMLGNDKLGDCTWAGMVHAWMITAQALGIKEKYPTATQVGNGYLKYNDGQDVGCAEATLLQYWLTHTTLGHKIAAYAPTDKSDFQEMKSIINAYGCVYIGIQVPEPCEQQFANNQPWALTNTPADDKILGGHCVVIGGYDENYFYVITWGAIQAVEPSWLAKYLDESWAIITPEIVKAGKYGDLRLEELQADIKSLAA